MRSLEDLFEEVRRLGIPGPRILSREWESVTGRVTLPGDLIRFFQEVGDGALLEFDDGDFRLSEIGDLKSPAFLLNDANVRWIEICDVGDGNCIAVDLDTVDESQCHVIDVFHETAGQPGESRIIAKSFTEFLDRILYTQSSYWLDHGFSGYGDAFDGNI